MTDECFRLDELDSLLDLAHGDPRWRHLAECPLCRARLAAYRAFLAEGPPLAGSRPEKAKADIEACIDGMVHGGAETKSGSRARMRAHTIPKRVLIPGLVTAAAAVVLIFSLHRFSGDDRPRPAPLRGVKSTRVGGATPVARPAVIRDGTVTFSWSRVPDADCYQVLIFDMNLEEVARFEAKNDTILSIRADEIAQAGGPLLWRIVAYREGDELSRSRPRSFDPGGR